MKRFLIFSVFITCLAANAVSNMNSKARWIWYPEEFGPATTNASRFARLAFEWKAADGQHAEFHFRADDSAAVWFNGKQLGGAQRIKSHSIGYDLSSLLVDGKNVLCVEIRNGAGPGCLIGHLFLTAPGRKKQDYFTDKSWKIYRTAESGWLGAGFDDSKGAIPKDLGNTLTAPWSDTFDIVELYDDEERKLYEKETAEGKRVMNEMVEKLNAEPELNVALEVKPGTNPKVLLNGRKVDALLYGAPYTWPYEDSRTIDKIHNFREAGMNLMFLGIETNVWSADGTINERKISECLYKALLLNPDAYLMLAINLNGAPWWWMNKNPDELMDYAVGGVDPKAGDPIKNVRAPSYASLKWRADTREYLKKVVSFVESIPAGKRVFSYRVDYGVYREWHYYGMRDNLPGSCRAMGVAFRKYLADKYGTDKALQAAWHDNTVTLATAEIPSAEERNASIVNGNTLRDPVKQAKVIDFLHCMQYAMRDLVISCNTAVKEACGYRKLCGNYHGYLFGMHYPVEAWHLENEATLASGVVDWQSSPNLYSNREVDDAEFGRAPVESFILNGKLNIQEHDSRTYLAVEETYHRHVTTPAQSVTTLARDFAQSLCRNAGCWYMDFARHWYNDPEIFAFFRKVEPIRALATNNAPVSEVVVVADLESVYYNRIGTTYIDLMLDANAQELTHTGTPFDVLLFNDLKHPNVRDYKVYVFANLCYVTPEKVAVIRKLQAAGKTIVWLYAPGYLTPQGHSEDYIEALTGFAAYEHLDPRDGKAFLADGTAMTPVTNIQMCPSFSIVDTKAKPLAFRSADNHNETTFAVKDTKGSRAYYSTTGFLSRDAWKSIFSENGVHCYENSGRAVVWTSNSFISINGKAGKYTLTLPRERIVTPLLPEKGEKSKTQQKTIEVELTDEIGMRLFYLE